PPRSPPCPSTTLFRSLSATRLGRRVELEATVDLPSFARPDAPLRRLWAKRRIDFLQDEIWWHGDGASSELRDEIVRLSLAERIRSEEHTSELQSRENL